MISVAIVEDAPADAQLLQACVERYGAENGLKFTVTVFPDAVEFLERYRPIYDVVFMDIQMPYFDGLKAAEKLRELDETALLVFVTTLEQYAVKGDEVSAMDYIVKPVQYPSMFVKLRRIVRALERASGDGMVLSFGAESLRVKVADIMWFEAVEHVITVHFREGEPFRVRKSLAALEEELAHYHFIRANKYTLLNPRYVTYTNGQELHLGDTVIPVSRARRRAVTEKLTDYYIGAR